MSVQAHDRDPAAKERASKRRRLLALTGVGLVTLTMLLALSIRTAADSNEIDASGPPGFVNPTRGTDSGAFRAARPTTTAGPTTMPVSPTSSTPPLPPEEDPAPAGPVGTSPTGDDRGNVVGGGVQPGGQSWPNAASQNEGSAFTPQTTTTIPTVVVLPGSISSICGLTTSVMSIEAVFTSRSDNVADIAARLQANMDRYHDVASNDLKPSVDDLRQVIGMVVNELRTANWDTTAPGVQNSVRAIREMAPPFDRFIPSGRRLQFAELLLCGR